MVPIVTESQMKNVRDFDRFIAKSDSEAHVLQLEQEVEKIADKLDGELAEIDKTRFQHLKKACEHHEEIPKKKCETIVNRNITALTREVKDHVKGMREQSKKLRAEIKTIKDAKQNTLIRIKNRILNYPELFERYKKSTYAVLRNACSTTIRTSAQFLDAVKDIPEVQELNRLIEAYKEEINAIENQQLVSKNVLKLKIKAAKEMLRDPYLAPLERSVLELTVRAYQKEGRKTAKNQDQKEEIEGLQSDIKKVESEKKTVFSHIRKSIKKMVKDRKKDERESKKEIRNLRKTMRKQGKLVDEIESDEIKDMVARREILIERDLDEFGEEEREKELEKLRKQKEKAEEREEKAKEKKAEKDRAAKEKQAEKERAQLEKKRQQEAAKTKKNQDKKEAKDKAKADKAHAKAEAKTRKMQEKAHAKAEAKKSKK
jgi:hypothetical protein